MLIGSCERDFQRGEMIDRGTKMVTRGRHEPEGRSVRGGRYEVQYAVLPVVMVNIRTA